MLSRSTRVRERWWARKIRINSNHTNGPSPAFVPLTLFRGVAGVAFLCFGELFWMHFSRIGLDGESRVMGSMTLVLGVVMILGAVCGAAGIMFSADEVGRLPLVVSVYLSAPLSLADFIVALTFFFKRAAVLRYDRDHEEQRGGGRQPSPPGPDPDSDPQDDPESRAASFRQLYDLFLALALAFSVLEMLIFRLGRRRLGTGLSAGDNGRGRAGSRGLMFSNGLESLLDEEDLRQTGWEGWSAESVQQNLEMEQRYEQLRRTSLEKDEDLLEHTRGRNPSNL